MTEASATTKKMFHNPYFFGGGRARYLLTIALLPLSKSDPLDPNSDFFLIKISSKFLLKSYFLGKS